MVEIELDKIVESKKADLRTIAVASVTALAFLVTFAFSFKTLPLNTYIILGASLLLTIFISYVSIIVGTDVLQRNEPHKTFDVLYGISVSLFAGAVFLLLLVFFGFETIVNLFLVIFVVLIFLIISLRYEYKFKLDWKIKKRKFSS